MFENLMDEISQEIITKMFLSATNMEAFEKVFAAAPGSQKLIYQAAEADGAAGEMDYSGNAPEEAGEEVMEIEIPTFRNDQPKVGRNDDCPCGSGKKYKKCCGK